MAGVLKYQIAWSNFPGQPGVTTMFFNPSTSDFSPVRTFFEAIKGRLVNGLQLTYPTVCDVLDVATGQVTGVQTVSTLASTTSSATTQLYSGATGTQIKWVTNGFVNGHRVAGRTFLVPLPSTEFNTTGQIATASQTAIQAAAQAMITSFGTNFVIFARPFKATVTKPARAGSIWPVTQAVVPNLAYVMRSRRA